MSGKIENNNGGKAIAFEHVNSLKNVNVHAKKNETLGELWDEAYIKLEEPRRDGDRLQTDGGVDVMPYLSMTLSQLRDEQGIKTRKFEIIGPTGGA